MKMIITACRNPTLTRPQFFRHLRHVHWPLVRDHERVAAALDGYIQNHALGKDSPAPDNAPYRIAIDRDSVIELFFGSEEGLRRLAETPEYLEHVRPDEARFNDLPHNIMVKTQPETVFEARTVGRCKLFDFLMPLEGINAADFKLELAAHSAELCLDPAYSAVVDRHVDNWAINALDGAHMGFGAGSFACVREIWASSFTAFQSEAVVRRDVSVVDAEASFSVFATEFPMIDKMNRNLQYKN